MVQFNALIVRRMENWQGLQRDFYQRKSNRIFLPSSIFREKIKASDIKALTHFNLMRIGESETTRTLTLLST